MLAMAWVAAIICSMPQVFLSHVLHHHLILPPRCVTLQISSFPSNQTQKMVNIYLMISYCLIWFVPLLVMIGCYLTIIVIIQKKTKQFSNCSSGNIGKAKMKTVKITGILIFGFLLCVTPTASIEIRRFWLVDIIFWSMF